MQAFLFGALAIALFVVLFALQNVVPVTVTFLAWTFEGSLGLFLFVALMSGVLVSFLASLPTVIKARLAATHQRKEVAALKTNIEEYRVKLIDAQRKLSSIKPGSPAGPGSAVERTPSP